MIFRIAAKAGSVGEKVGQKSIKRKGDPSENYVEKSKKEIAEAKNQEEKERKALRTIALLLLTFAFCWLPLSFIFIITALRPNYLSQWWMISGYWLGYVNSMLNPVCYAIGNPFFKETLLKIFCSKK